MKFFSLSSGFELKIRSPVKAWVFEGNILNTFTIGIDASRAFLEKRTGIEEYSYQVIRYLGNELAGERVVLYVRRNQSINFDIPKAWRIRTLGWSRFWTQGGLALEMLRHPVNALFVPAHTVPWIHPKKTVVTIHGLEYEFCPEAYSWWERVYMRWSIRNSCRWASKIIAVSENTKRDLMRLYGVAEERVSVIYEGIGNSESGENSAESIGDSKLSSFVSKLFSDSCRYLLFVGRVETRKNVARMVGAFDIFKRKYGTDHKLVLAGKPGYGYKKIREVVSESAHAKDILELGYVSEEEKRKLLRHATGFLFPSLYEGFGLPVLEAQSVGVPVLTSNTSSLPEVSGAGSTVLVDPLSIKDIALGIEKIALESDFRNAIIKNGRRNVGRFSWESCAKQIARELVDGR